jgi:hypothetical protein
MRARVIAKSIKDVRLIQRFFCDGFGPAMEQETEFRHSILNTAFLDFGQLGPIV